MKKPKAVFFIYDDFRLNLYFFLARIFYKKGHEITYVVNDKETHDFLIKNSSFSDVINYRIFYKSNSHLLNDFIKSSILNTVDIDTNRFSLERAIRKYKQTDDILNSIIVENESFLIFGGGGSHVEDIAIKNYCKNKLNVRHCFTELSNINGKTFLDPCGANVSSLFYTLQDSSIEHIKMNEFYDDFNSLNSHINKIKSDPKYKPKQSFKKTPIKIFNSICKDFIFNFDSTLSSKVLSYSLSNYKMFFLNNIFAKNNKFLIKDTLPNKYFFVPLQVSTDTQLLYNSDYDNLQTIKYYQKKAELLNLSLVVKMHPAEKSKIERERLYDYCKSNFIHITEKNTLDLISNSEVIGVNNSTVGLEAILLGKNVEFIGRSFYKKFNDKRWLYFYLFEYLIDIDFFNPETNDEDLIYNQVLSKFLLEF